MNEIQKLEGHSDRVWSVAFHPGGDMLASCSGDRTIRIWQRAPRSPETWICSAILEKTHNRTIRHVTFSPDGRYLAAASFDATVSIWEHHGGPSSNARGRRPPSDSNDDDEDSPSAADDAHDVAWENVATLEGHENEVKCVAFSHPVGQFLATCSRDKSVWIWESNPGHDFDTVDVKQGHAQDVKYVAWHPAGDLLVSASYDDTIKLWMDNGADEWTCAQTLSSTSGNGHASTVWGVAFDPSGERMASCSDDKSVKIWSTARDARGKPAWRLLTTLEGHHERTIFSVDWSVRGWLATGGGDDAIAIYAPKQNAEGGMGDNEDNVQFKLAHLQHHAHAGDVNSVRFHPTDPTLLASGGDDGIVRIWRIAQ